MKVLPGQTVSNSGAGSAAPYQLLAELLVLFLPVVIVVVVVVVAYELLLYLTNNPLKIELTRIVFKDSVESNQQKLLYPSTHPIFQACTL
jgi:hypothetical protein